MDQEWKRAHKESCICTPEGLVRIEHKQYKSMDLPALCQQFRMMVM